MSEKNNMAYCFACDKDGGNLILLAQPPTGSACFVCEECRKNRNTTELINEAKEHYHKKHFPAEPESEGEKTTDETAAELHAEDTEEAESAEALANAEFAAAELDESIDKLKTELE